MTTGALLRTDLNHINHVVQNTVLQATTDMIIGILRDEFAKDSYYHYQADEYGFPKTPSLLNKPLDAGYDNDETTRIFIGEYFRHNIIYYPAIFVKSGQMSYVPISFNRERECVKYDVIKVIDGYGNSKLYTTPTHFIFAGAWEGSVSVDIVCRDILSRNEIAGFCAILFQDIKHDDFLRAGIAIKKVSIGSPTETQDRQQDPLYKVSVTLDIRTEWRREIPVDSTVDMINFCVEFGYLDTDPEQIAPNLTINTYISLDEQIDLL